MEPNNIKALYRRAAANKGLKKYPEAAKDLKFVVEKDPGNKPAALLLDQVSWKMFFYNFCIIFTLRKVNLVVSLSRGRVKMGRLR